MLKRTSLLITIIIIIFKINSNACTGISLKLDNNQIIQARTIE